MSAGKEAMPGELRLYRESLACYIVRTVATPDTEAEWRYEFEILKVLDGHRFDRVGENFTVSKNKEDGQMGGWYTFPLDSPYAQGWLAAKNIDLATII